MIIKHVKPTRHLRTSFASLQISLWILQLKLKCLQITTNLTPPRDVRHQIVIKGRRLQTSVFVPCCEQDAANSRPRRTNCCIQFVSLALSPRKMQTDSYNHKLLLIILLFLLLKYSNIQGLKLPYFGDKYRPPVWKLFFFF